MHFGWNVMSIDVKPMTVNFFYSYTLAISFNFDFPNHLHKWNSSSDGNSWDSLTKSFCKWDHQAPRSSDWKLCYCFIRKCILISQVPNPAFFSNVSYSEPCNIWYMTYIWNKYGDICFIIENDIDLCNFAVSSKY